MKLKEIQRTSTFAWAPYSSTPLLVTGTVAGALDASFTNESQLEIWDLDFMNRDELAIGGEGQKGPSATVTINSRSVGPGATYCSFTIAKVWNYPIRCALDSTNLPGE